MVLVKASLGYREYNISPTAKLVHCYLMSVFPAKVIDSMTMPRTSFTHPTQHRGQGQTPDSRRIVRNLLTPRSMRRVGLYHDTDPEDYPGHIQKMDIVVTNTLYKRGLSSVVAL